MKIAAVLFSCLVALDPLHVRAADYVTFKDEGKSVVLDNGLVSVEVEKGSGNILKLTSRGRSLMSEPAYLDWQTGKANHISAGVFTLQTDPTGNGGALAEVSVMQKFAGQGEAFDIELHHVLRRGDSGFYSYAVFTHPKGYAPAGMAQSRMVYRLDDAVFDFIQVDASRRKLMPDSNTPQKILGPKESGQFTEGPFKDFITDKYHFFADAGDHFFHGWTGTKSQIGCWMVNASNEDRNGGPTKQHNTEHFGRMLFKILTCGHYGATGVNVGDEAWQKIYGPWMVYVNSGGDADALWADAQKKAATERAAWPYPWVNHPAYPQAAGRGTVTGQIAIRDPQDAKASPAGTWVGLATPGLDWQKESKGYQYWVHAEKDGRFTIPNVRPGDYTLSAFVDGVMDEFHRADVKVFTGKPLDLGQLAWTPMRYGKQLWQIGTPDRTAQEFRHGDDYRQWGLWLKYPEEFPQDVNFTIGQSKERMDWNYAQVNVQKDGQWVGTKWNVLFNMDAPLKPGKATLRLALASTQNSRLRVLVNDQPAGQSPRFGEDNAMIRAGIHGQYSEWDATFPTTLLHPGENKISLEQLEGGSVQQSILYDCVRLEVPE